MKGFTEVPAPTLTDEQKAELLREITENLGFFVLALALIFLMAHFIAKYPNSYHVRMGIGQASPMKQRELTESLSKMSEYMLKAAKALGAFSVLWFLWKYAFG